jgi:lipoyl(octanoyl) transferase
VYVDQGGALAKIGALGLRVRKNCCYHGLSLNVDMNLSPFAAINPCGYPGMAVTQTRDLGMPLSPTQVAQALVSHLTRQLEHA